MTIDLYRFCDTESNYSLHESPFVIGGWKCATNGNLIIAVPTDEPDTTDRRVPRYLGDVFGTPGGKWQPFPDTDECLKCEGRGRIDGRCHHCNQEMVKDCDCKQHRIELHGRFTVSLFLAAKVSVLPTLEYAPRAESIDRVSCLCLRFDGGKGAMTLFEVESRK